MNVKTRSVSLKYFALILPLLVTVNTVLAGGGTFTWNGGGGDGNWTTGANWGGTAPSDPQNLLQFGGSTRLANTNNFGAGASGWKIDFLSGAGAFNLYGNSIAFFDFGSVDPFIQNDSATAQNVNISITNGNTHLSGAFYIMNLNAISGDLVFNGGLTCDGNQNRVFNLSGSRNLTFNGLIQNNGPSSKTVGLTQLGTGVAILNFNNSFTGQTTIGATGAGIGSQGTVQLGSGGTNGTAGSGTISLSTNATLVINRADSPVISNPLTLAGNASGTHGNVAVPAEKFAQLTGAITSSGQEMWVGDASNSGTVILNNTANAYSQSTVIQNGVLQVNDVSLAANSQSSGKGGIYIGAGGSGTLRYTGSTTTTDRIGSGSLQGTSAGSTIEIVSSGTILTNPAAIGNNSSGKGLTKAGPGTFYMTGANTYDGPTILAAGTLSLDYTSQANSKLGATAALTLQGGGTLNLAGGTFAQSVGSLSLSQGGGTLARPAGAATIALNNITYNAGSPINFSAASIATTTTGNNSASILGGWATVAGTDWAVASGSSPFSIIALASYTTLPASTYSSTTNYTMSANTSIGSGCNINSLKITANTLTLGANTMTVGSSGAGGVLATGGTIGASAGTDTGYLTAGSTSELLIANSASVNVYDLLVGNGTSGSFTKYGSGSLTLRRANNYTGATTVAAGTLFIGGGTDTASTASIGSGSVYIGGSAGLNINLNPGGSYTPIGGALTAIPGSSLTLNTAETVTLGSANLPANANNTFTYGTATGVSSGTMNLVLNGDATSITHVLNGNIPTSPAARALDIKSGIVYYGAGTSSGTKENLTIEGGTVIAPDPIYGFGNRFNQGGQAGITFNMTGGTLNVVKVGNAFSWRFGGTGSAGQGGATNVVGTQSGGTINTYNLDMGGSDTTASGSPSYALSGGTLNVLGGGGMQIGADAIGNGSTTFTLSGSGKLSVSGTLQGQTASAKQIFTFTGGTLAAGTVTTANLRDVVGSVNGTLVNAGGTLSPGDNGAAGKTTITGNYSASSASATLNIDIGGTSAAGVFQDANNTFDLVAVSGTASLNGALTVGLLNGFIPANANTFKILTTAASGRSGTFNNVYNGRATVSGTSGGSLTVTTNTADVTLGGYSTLQAGFTASPANAPAGTTVNFSATGAVGAITNWIVFFGDGTAYTNVIATGGTIPAGTITSHVYAGGTYTATNVVVASDGSTAQTTQAIAATSNPTLAWLGGVSAFWNTTQLNWTNLTSGGISTLYVDADPVVFNEMGSANPTVNLTNTVVPASVTFSNSATTYTVQGSGKISGNVSLVKSLAGTVIILTTNDFSGGTTINAGTLQLGDGASASGTLGGGSITDNGSLVLNPSSASSVTNVILGSGTLTVKNSTVTLTAANSYNGGTTVSNGATVSITADNNVGAAGGGVTLNAGTLQATNSFTLNNRGISLGAGGGTINSANTLTVTNVVTGNGALTNSGAGTLILAGGANNYSGLTTVSGGILQIGNSTATTMGTSGYSLASAATLQFNTTTSQTIASVDGAGATLKNNNTTGVITLNQSAGNHTIGTVSGVNAATVILAGASNSTNTISTALTPAGFLVKVNSGNWTNTTGGNTSANFEVNGGSWTLPVGAGGVNFQMNQNNQTFTMHGGQINLLNQYGFRMGNTFNVNSAAGGGNFTGTQDGGTILYAGGEGFQLGAINVAGVNASYTLSGTGIILITNNNFTLGSGTNSSTTTFTLTNSAKLSVNGTIGGSQGAGVIQNFIFGGGTLVAKAIDMTQLTTSGATTGTPSTLTNSGFGTLAPGDIGTSGKTTITGSYVQQSGSALAIDIGGTNVANAFQDAAGTYDRLAVSQSVSLSGNLNVSLINGFNPAPGQTFTIITATNISGNFTNLDVNQRVICTDSTRSFHVTTNATSVVLDGYQSTGIPSVAVTPASTNILYGNNILLSVNATGGGTLAYQWYDKGTNAIVGQTNSTLALTAPGVNASGNYTIIVTNAFGSATGLVAVTVSPAPLGVTANNSSRVYGAANPAFTASYSGFVNGDTTAVISGSPSLTTAAATNSPVGTYAITAAIGSLSAANYSFPNSTNGTLTVTRATITVTANNQSRGYGAANPTFTASYSGFVNGETSAVVSGSPVLTTGANTNSPVGSYAITNTVGSLSATNYAFTLVNGTLTITPAALGITANNASKVYDGVVFSGGNGVTYSGFVNGETNTVLGGTLSYGGTSQGATNVGSYTIVPSGLTSANYTIGFANGALNITPVNLTVTANNDSKAYGQTKTYGAGSTAFTSPGLQNGDTIGSVTITATSSPTNGTAATDPLVSYALTPSAATGGTFNAANYNISYVNGTLTVTQAIPSLTVTSSANPAGYNDSLTFTATLPVSATGTITFKTNSVAYVTNGLSGGTTNFSLSALPRGTNTITAIYSGDTNYLPTTNSLNQIVTNHPPVANAAAYTRSPAVNSFKVLVSDLLTHATDADGDTLALASVSATTNGATTLIAGGYVLYYNTNAVADQFTYKVNDAYGGTNSATVTINVDSTPLFGQSQIVSTSGGTATLNFAGIPGYNYSVNRSTNLTDWAVIWTTNAPSGGAFQFIDTSAPTPSAYYRLQFNHP